MMRKYSSLLTPELIEDMDEYTIQALFILLVEDLLILTTKDAKCNFN